MSSCGGDHAGEPAPAPVLGGCDADDLRDPVRDRRPHRGRDGCPSAAGENGATPRRSWLLAGRERSSSEGDAHDVGGLPEVVRTDGRDGQLLDPRLGLDQVVRRAGHQRRAQLLLHSGGAQRLCDPGRGFLDPFEPRKPLVGAKGLAQLLDRGCVRLGPVVRNRVVQVFERVVGSEGGREWRNAHDLSPRSGDRAQEGLKTDNRIDAAQETAPDHPHQALLPQAALGAAPLSGGREPGARRHRRLASLRPSSVRPAPQARERPPLRSSRT